MDKQHSAETVRELDWRAMLGCVWDNTNNDFYERDRGPREAHRRLEYLHRMPGDENEVKFAEAWAT